MAALAETLQIPNDTVIANPDGTITNVWLRVFKTLVANASTAEAFDPDDIIAELSYLTNRDYQSSASTSTLSLTPHDSTIPQIGEGDEIVSSSFTPTSATGRVRITATGNFGTNTASNAYGIAALFLNGDANAVITRDVFVTPTIGGGAFAFVYEYLPGVTTAQTIALRCGGSLAASVFLGRSAAVTLGATMLTTMVVEQVTK